MPIMEGEGADEEPADIEDGEYEPDADDRQQTMKVKTGERVVCEFVSWRDYREGKADTWSKVPWVARRVPMTRAKIEDRFGKGIVELCQVKFSGDNTEKRAQIEGKFTWVWEIWCRESNSVIFIAQDARIALEITDPFLSFDGFFPVPWARTLATTVSAPVSAMTTSFPSAPGPA